MPELDVIEALINVATGDGEISQTMQIAPYDPDYLWTNTSDTFLLTDTWDTTLNEYHGGVYQQVSLLRRAARSFPLTRTSTAVLFCIEQHRSTLVLSGGSELFQHLCCGVQAKSRR